MRPSLGMLLRELWILRQCRCLRPGQTPVQQVKAGKQAKQRFYQMRARTLDQRCHASNSRDRMQRILLHCIMQNRQKVKDTHQACDQLIASSLNGHLDVLHVYQRGRLALRVLANPGSSVGLSYTYVDMRVHMKNSRHCMETVNW